MARSSSCPAGPTKGLPWRSSWSPGCSPTRAIEAPTGPSPKTACPAPGTIGLDAAMTALRSSRVLGSDSCLRGMSLARALFAGMVPRLALACRQAERAEGIHCSLRFEEEIGGQTPTNLEYARQTPP